MTVGILLSISFWSLLAALYAATHMSGALWTGTYAGISFVAGLLACLVINRRLRSEG